MRPSALPKCIQLGIPAALGSSFTQPFRGHALQPATELEPRESKLIGAPVGSTASYAASCDNKVLQGLLDEDGLRQEALNARQSFQILKQLKSGPCIIIPYICHPAAPSTINVYTYGSWKFPLRFHFSVGGAGVWWPSRKQTGHPLSEGEQQLAHHKASEDGIRLCTPIGGYAGSSTRTELAAGILAISAHGPVHIGSDSQVFVDGANQILSDLGQGIETHPNWKLTADGDLWEHFYIAAKGSKGIGPFA